MSENWFGQSYDNFIMVVNTSNEIDGYDSFDKVFSNDDSFIGKDKGLKIVSGSYMFDTYKQINNNGNINVIMKMKNFENFGGLLFPFKSSIGQKLLLAWAGLRGVASIVFANNSLIGVKSPQ